MITVFASYSFIFTGTRNCPIWPCVPFCQEKLENFTGFYHHHHHHPFCPRPITLSLLVLGLDCFYSKPTLLVADSRIFSSNSPFSNYCPLDCINLHQCINMVYILPSLKKQNKKPLKSYISSYLWLHLYFSLKQNSGISCLHSYLYFIFSFSF